MNGGQKYLCYSLLFMCCIHYHSAIKISILSTLDTTWFGWIRILLFLPYFSILRCCLHWNTSNWILSSVHTILVSVCSCNLLPYSWLHHLWYCNTRMADGNITAAGWIFRWSRIYTKLLLCQWQQCTVCSTDEGKWCQDRQKLRCRIASQTSWIPFFWIPFGISNRSR